MTSIMKGTGQMDILLSSLTGTQEYAVRNILQSLQNAKTYCSYLDDNDLRWELESMIELLAKRAVRKIKENF